MTLQQRHNVRIHGYGPSSIVCAHGFGCDQSMWRFLTPALGERYTVITYDLAGCGQSERRAYDPERHATLHGHALDLIDIVEEFANGPVAVIGHSVSAIIGMLATIKAPGRFAAQVMVSPSPCYLDDDDYPGGFSRQEVVQMLDSMDADYARWCDDIAPVIMGAPGQPEMAAELRRIFSGNNPDTARHFARVTFLSDYRADVARSATPALILQSSEDRLAPPAVGEWMRRHMPNSSLRLVENDGHCPHMSAPSAIAKEIGHFLAGALP